MVGLRFIFALVYFCLYICIYPLLKFIVFFFALRNNNKNCDPNLQSKVAKRLTPLKHHERTRSGVVACIYFFFVFVFAVISPLLYTPILFNFILLCAFFAFVLVFSSAAAILFGFCGKVFMCDALACALPTCAFYVFDFFFFCCFFSYTFCYPSFI